MRRKIQSPLRPGRCTTRSDVAAAVRCNVPSSAAQDALSRRVQHDPATQPLQQGPRFEPHGRPAGPCRKITGDGEGRPSTLGASCPRRGLVRPRVLEGTLTRTVGGWPGLHHGAPAKVPSETALASALRVVWFDCACAAPRTCRRFQRPARLVDVRGGPAGVDPARLPRAGRDVHDVGHQRRRPGSVPLHGHEAGARKLRAPHLVNGFILSSGTRGSGVPGRVLQDQRGSPEATLAN